MRTYLNFKLISASRILRFASSAFGRRGGYVAVYVLLTALTFPLISIGQDEGGADDRRPVSQADEPSRPDAIVFILDCSYSMNDDMPIAPAGRDSRFNVAMGGLAAVLDEIARSNEAGTQIMVGIRCFGHRVGWVPGQTPPRMVVQPKLQGRVPAELRPSRDVELIKPLGRFGLGELQATKNELQQIDPWGETPLFLALEQALADFDPVPPNAKKCIVLITDGKNEQFEPTTTLSDVLRAWQENQVVQIHILGIDLRQQQAQAARAEHGRLANVTGGTFSEIASGNELLQKLRQLLNLNGN